MLTARPVSNLLILLVLFLASLPSLAATLAVDREDPNCDDTTGAPFCRIQPAIDAALFGDTINIAAGTYLGAAGASAVIVVPAGKSLTLRGAGADSLILRGSDQGRRGIIVQPGAALSISGFSVSGAALGLDSEHGAGVKNLGQLTLSSCIIDRNTSAGNGGGIYSESVLIIDNCTISNNASLRAGAVSQNSGGGGIYASGRFELRNSVLYDNQAAFGGGGVMLDDTAAPASATISNSRILRNVAKQGGGILSRVDLTLRHSSIFTNSASLDGGGSGGGVVIESAVSANIVNSLIYYNQAYTGGGGLFHGAAASVNIYSSSIINNTTLGGNGGGIYADKNAGVVTLGNSLISGNRDRGVSATDPESPDCSGTLQSLGYNLLASSRNCRLTTAAGDLEDVDARLKISSAGGGTAQLITVALGSDSPAIDRGNPNGCLDQLQIAIAADLAGNNRTLDGDQDGVARCDIGAFEAVPGPAQVTPPAPDPDPGAGPVNTAAASSGGGGALASWGLGLLWAWRRLLLR